ncbi:protein male-specific lethal-3 [Drosophila pseudoobscura]|uniref:Protein male-specific lethal-3 n=1 Tax=Drosophila pseudoobscura pseudoobscura TaxID=46245 RepID=Q2M0T3_DROPS|nr:protein male-specific lethal-3 [Drosophila pseudoobscura]
MTAKEDEVQVFNKGEKVLCYEPDKSKARVLYNSKVLTVVERRDEHGLRYYDYKIHFQGWRPSYDRAVRASCLLKDTEENRNLQRELAEAAQLQISGGYSYKGTPSQPPSKKKRLTRVGGNVEDQEPALDTTQGQKEPEVPPTNGSQPAAGNRSRENSGGRKAEKSIGAEELKMRNTRGHSTGKKPAKKETVEVEKYVVQEDRVMLRISERLREYMEYDYNMIVKLGKQHAMPARMPIICILENFVKQRAVELAIGIKQDSKRNTQSRNARMEREYDRVMSNVCMLKEVVDGLRIYFEFHVEDHLLYKEEKEYAYNYLTDDNLKNVSVKLNSSYDFINPNCDTELISMEGTQGGASAPGPINNYGSQIINGLEYEKQFQRCLLYIAKSSGKNTANSYDPRTCPYTAADKLPMEMRGFLRETFKWRLLSAESMPEKSMVFGAPHLARLMIKVPEYLNISPISNQKLEDLLPHLDSFINYLENHKEWFDKENYVHHPTVHQEQLQRELLVSLEQTA